MKNILFLVIGVTIFFLLPQKAFAQSMYLWEIDADFVVKEKKRVSVFSDSVALMNALDEYVKELRNDGFLVASIDTIRIVDSLWRVSLFRGPQFQWGDIAFTGATASVRNYASQKVKKWISRSVQLQALNRLQDELVLQMANTGYPFAQAERILSVSDDQQVLAEVILETGGSYVFDSLYVKGDTRINHDFLKQYLHFEVGQRFDYSRIQDIPRRIQELPFVKLTQPPNVVFEQGKYALQLEVEPERASRFDFLIGVLPNSPTTNRLLITGDLEADFLNAFGRGEHLYISFERLRPETQDLQVSAMIPYLFQLPFGVEGTFSVYRRDSSFLNVDLTAGLQYEWDPGFKGRIHLAQSNTNLLAVDTALITSSNTLPDQLDTRQSSVELGIEINQLDYRFNPRKGYMAKVSATAGLRNILLNNDIEETDAVVLYDALERESAMFQLHSLVACFIPVFQRSTIRMSTDLGFKWSRGGILRNEQFRLGGNRLLRGFDEEFFFATSYAVSSAEYRFLLDRNAFLFAFGDYAWVENNQFKTGETVDFPYGFGAGITFETSSGLFTLSLASGGQRGQPLDLSAPKVHLGFQSLF
ncbi:MAG: BamA/TamA family outer membrane protein [Saprospiraceae bacterium]|nr:BamA/TamA family outer membrane protein [Saprospiraceae bacterium]